MGHLQRIILIHTHLQSVVELRLDAHANICGNNAAGKTTLQRLIPVFYGEQPNRVVPRTRKAFHQFYLPHGNSYLVYEYQREAGETVMVALTRQAQGGVEYRFVPSGYRAEFFLLDTEQGPQGVDYRQWLANLRKAGINYPRKLESTSDYRAVILNDWTTSAGSKKEQAALRQIALQFSLVQPGHRLRHMEKLVSAVHAREGKMQTLKTMLAAIFEEDGVELPVTRLRREQARRWIHSMRQALNLEGLQAGFSRWQDTGHALAEVETRLARMAPRLQRDLANQKTRLADAEAGLRGLERQLQTLREAYEEARGSLRRRQLDQQEEAGKLKLTLQDMQTRYEGFQEGELPALERDTQELPAWREDLERKRAHLESLQEEVGELQRQFDRQKADRLERLQEQNQRSQGRMDAIRAKLDALRKRHGQTRQALEQELQQARDTAQQQFTQVQLAVMERLSEVKTQLQGDFLNFDERTEREQATARIEQQQEANRLAGEQLNQRRDVLHRASQVHQQAVQWHEELLKKRSTQEKTCLRLREQLEPASGSLRRFLRDEQPGWEKTLGKLLRSELLERRDLTPQSTPTTSGVYGVQLDLSRVEVPPHALDDVAVQQALEAAQAELESMRQEVKRQEEGARALEAAAQKAEQEQHAAERQAKRAQEDVGHAQVARDQLVQELQAHTRERRRKCTQQREELQHRQQELQKQQEQALATLDQTQQAQRQELRTDQDAAEAHEENRIAQIKREMHTRKSEFDGELEELQNRLHADMAGRGIDTASITRAQEQVRQRGQRIYQTEQRAVELAEYQRFMRVEWQQERPTALRRQSELETLLQNVKQAIEKEEHAHQQSRNKLREQEKQWQQQKQAAARHKEQLQPLHDGLARLQLDEGAENLTGNDPWPGADQDERLLRARDALHERTALADQMDEQRQRLNRALTGGASDDFITRLNQGQAQLEQDGKPHPAAYLPLYQKLLTLLADQQTELTQQGRNMGGDLNKFFTVFRDLNRRIAAQGRRLSEEVGDDLPLEGIGKAEVRLYSTIDELEFWQPLTEFSALYEAWENSGRNQPDTAYLDALGQVVEVLRQDQSWRFEDLLQLELRLSEGGSELVIRNDKQLLESSSHGMAYLILCRFLLAFTRLLRRDAQVIIHWPIDEIGTLHYSNVERLFQACDQNHIFVLGAFPNAESDVLQLFQHRYLVERTRADGERRHLKRIEPRVSPLAEKLLQVQQAQQMEASA